MKICLTWKRLPINFIILGISILFFPLLIPLTGAGTHQGEGTGHQRVRNILGCFVASQKIYFNDSDNSSYKQLAKKIHRQDILVIILQNEEVISGEAVQDMYFFQDSKNFGDLESVTLEERIIDKDDILAIIIK